MDICSSVEQVLLPRFHVNLQVSESILDARCLSDAFGLRQATTNCGSAKF
jgi:hypothetical protein